MPYYSVEDFKSGLDVRRSRYTSVAGTLQKLVNAHITRGGDIEKRKAFVSVGSLHDTFGLEADTEGLVVFGSALTPGGILPDAVRYQRLVAPSGASMTGIAAATLFGGKLYVAANFDDGRQWHFYDGVLVGDWNGGLVLDNPTPSSVAESLRALVDADARFSAQRTDATVDITGPLGVDFDTQARFKGVDGAAPDMGFLVSVTQAAEPTIAGAQAQAEFAILSGAPGNGHGIAQVTASGYGSPVDLLADPVDFTTPQETASAVAAAINAGTGTHKYIATSDTGRVRVRASKDSGSTPNGALLEVHATGAVVLYNGSFTITGGSEAAGTNQVASVRANGKALCGAVDWVGSNSQTAASVADAINAYNSAPKYNAHAEGGAVFLSPAVIRTDDPVDISLDVTGSGDVTLEAGGTAQVTREYPSADGGGGSVGGGPARDQTQTRVAQ